ncbi:MAG: hypothetical protein K2P41_15135, partial [Lachnospiraceae bacterium]|nr:hypothetical protein [Lachnospiraceae bacterium]
MMVFLSLRVTADAEGGLKIRAHQRPDLQGFGGGSHQQARAGYIPAHCLPLLPYQPHSINYFALSLPQFERQAHLGAYPAHWQFSKE